MTVRQDLPGRRSRAWRSDSASSHGDRAGHHRCRHREHGAGHPRDLGAARPRSARLHAGGVRRRRPAACRAAGARVGDRPHPGAAQSRHPVRHGPAADRSARRFRYTRLQALSRRSAAGSSEAFRDAACAGRRVVRGRRDRARRRVASRRTIDMRYAGQNYELSVPLPGGPINAATLDGAGASNSPRRTSGMYGFVAEGEPVQLVTFRVEAVGLVHKADSSRSRTPARTRRRRDRWRGARCGCRRRAVSYCPVYDRERLRHGNRIAGPAIVEQMDATTVVLPGRSRRRSVPQPDYGGHEHGHRRARSASPPAATLRASIRLPSR